jgi:hypothetical protein
MEIRRIKPVWETIFDGATDSFENLGRLGIGDKIKIIYRSQLPTVLGNYQDWGTIKTDHANETYIQLSGARNDRREHLGNIRVRVDLGKLVVVQREVGTEFDKQ